MRIHGVESSDDFTRIMTSAATITFLCDGSWAASAGSGERALATGQLSPPTGPWRITDQDDDSVVIIGGSWQLRINGDSLVELQRRGEPGDVSIRTEFIPVIATHRRRGSFLADEQGGVAAWPITRSRIARRTRGAHIAMARDGVAWISIFPPRPPRRDHLSWTIAHEGRPSPFPGGAYPDEAALAEAAEHTNLMTLHAYFWKEEDAALRPKLSRYRFRRCPWRSARHVPEDAERLASFRDHCRRVGLPLVLYVSPRYSTAPKILDELSRIIEAHEPDGLYLDGIGGGAPHIRDTVRGARRILGPDRLLYLNATNEPFGAALPCPAIDAWADFVLRGDSGRGGLSRSHFLRYGVSGWNVSGAVGVWCHYGSWGGPMPLDRVPPARDVRDALAHHARIWRRSFWSPAADLAAHDELYGRELESLVSREVAALDGTPDTATRTAGP